MKRRLSNVVAASIAAAAALVATLAAGPAHAVELYWNGTTRVVVHHNPVVVAPPPPPPRVLVVRRPVVQVPSPRVIVTAPPPPVTTVVTQPEPVVVDEPRDERDPYATPGIVVAGAGMGGMFFLGDGITGVTTAYKLHVGLAVGAAEFALRFDLAPDAMDLTMADGGKTPAALYTTGASFNYRFLPGATVHPVAGVGLEGIILDPHEGETGTAFAVTARAGLELAYPLSDGALALGIDLTGHKPFGATAEYSADVVPMLTFGAYGDYRF